MRLNDLHRNGVLIASAFYLTLTLEFQIPRLMRPDNISTPTMECIVISLAHSQALLEDWRQRWDLNGYLNSTGFTSRTTIYPQKPMVPNSVVLAVF